MAIRMVSQADLVMGQLLDAAEKRAYRIAILQRNHIVKSMAGPRSGKWYTVPGTSRRYQASAPGEYPAVRTGFLRADVKFKVVRDNLGVYAFVGADVYYAGYVENMRPWLQRSFEEIQPQVEQIMAEPLI